MKKLVLLFAVVAAVACVSCTAKKDAAPAGVDTTKVAPAPAADTTAVKADTAKVATPAK